MNSIAVLAARSLALSLTVASLNLVSAAPVHAQEATAPALTLGERLGAEIRERFDQGDLASLQVAVRHGDELLWSGALGYADLEHQVSAGPQTIYRIASVTKQFTAARLLQQVAEGEIGLEDDVRGALPDLPTGGYAVTVRQLLDHTSGIPSYTDLGPKWVQDMGRALRWKGLLELLADEEHVFEPGTDWAYNNSAYFAVGELSAELGRGGFRRQIEKELLAPLGLEHTSVEDHAALIPHRARGYSHFEFSNTFRNAQYMHPSQPGGAGALLSTCEDLVAWELLLMGGQVLTPDLLAEMTTSSVLADGREPGYGFGLSLGELRGVERWHHSGGIFGSSSYLAGYPDADLAIALITNTGDKGLGRLELELAELVLEELGFAAPAPEAGPALTETEAAPYLGTYSFNGLEGLVEWNPDRGLVAKFQGERRFELRPTGEHQLRVVANPAGPEGEPEEFTAEEAERLDVTLRFQRFDDGRAERCTLVQRGSRQTGVRSSDAEAIQTAMSHLAGLSRAVEMFAIEMAGQYPSNLDQLISHPDLEFPLVNADLLPNDPWDRTYLYDAPEEGNGYRVYTLGRDGEVGGTGVDADLDHRQAVAAENGSEDLPSSLQFAHQAKARADIAALCNAIDMYAIENAGLHPVSLQELVAPSDGGASYLKGARVPTDPWGAIYAYEPPTEQAPYRVFTLGKDGQEGGEGEDADVSNRDD
ncbi:MAG: serine hydrolase [Planctomycetota bacterium]